MCARVLYLSLHGQPHTVFGGFLFTSTGWTLSLKDRIMAEVFFPHCVNVLLHRPKRSMGLCFVMSSANIATVCINVVQLRS